MRSTHRLLVVTWSNFQVSSSIFQNLRIFEVFRPDRFAKKAKDSESLISRSGETLRQILLTSALNISKLGLNLIKRGSDCQRFLVKIEIFKILQSAV